MNGSYHLPELVLRELLASNACWTIEHGKKHGKLIVNGELCGIISKGRSKQEDFRAVRNLRAQVKRALNKGGGI
ncbi:hypothetical protein GOC60_14865 [Sinorhizobium meliloti]|nr:hypothetical protein [Sinorhizobium meliloti]